MEARTPPLSRASRSSLSERPYGRRMGISWADDPAGQTRRPAAAVKIREVLNAIFYVLSTGCQWRALPKDLPPKSAAHFYFTLWDWDGTLERIHHELHVAVREREGREPSPNGGDHRKPECQGRSKRRLLMRARRLGAASAVSLSIRPACS